MEGVDFAVAPVSEEESLLVSFGELGTVAEREAGGGTFADIDDTSEAVRGVVRPFAAAGSPAELCTAGDVVDSGRAVPGGAEVPFHIGVEGEPFAIGIAGEVIGVAQADGDEFECGGFGVEAADPAARAVFSPDAVGLHEVGQEFIRCPVFGDERTF
ncbi:MAG: hypothetical protein RI897_3652 [Verrucomicrobiota bacterium]